MTELRPPTVLAEARQEFDRLVDEIRVDLYHYCARMTGSAVDGEDVVQEALAKAYYLLPTTDAVANLRGWLFRIAHNKAIDFLRRYDRRMGEDLAEHPELASDEVPLEASEMARLALSHYLKLTALQRSCVILKDVMDYSLVELSELLDLSVPAIKGALHRGRLALRQSSDLARSDQPAALDPEQARLLAAYVDRFNARDFDTLRDWLLDDVRLELVNRKQMRGAVSVGSYFTNYDRIDGWHVVAGLVEGKPAVLGFDGPAAARLADAAPGNAPRPQFFILLQWRGEQVASIRDFRYARHVAELARFEIVD